SGQLRCSHSLLRVRGPTKKGDSATGRWSKRPLRKRPTGEIATTKRQLFLPWRKVAGVLPATLRACRPNLTAAQGPRTAARVLRAFFEKPKPEQKTAITVSAGNSV
ncbi:MAG: hypothetical protein WA777_09030, partial [Rhodanobacter sp.]